MQRASLSDDFRDSLFAQFAHFYEKNEFCDFTITVGEKVLRCHKLVLASASSKFRQWFRTDPQANSWNAFNASYENVKSVIDFIYFGKLTMTNSNHGDVIRTGIELGVSVKKKMIQANGNAKISKNKSPLSRMAETSDHYNYPFKKPAEVSRQQDAGTKVSSPVAKESSPKRPIEARPDSAVDLTVQISPSQAPLTWKPSQSQVTENFITPGGTSSKDVTTSGDSVAVCENNTDMEEQEDDFLPFSQVVPERNSPNEISDEAEAVQPKKPKTIRCYFDMCKSRFQSNRQLHCHVKTFHKHEPIECKICKKKYKKGALFAKHMLNLHADYVMEKHDEKNRSNISDLFEN